MKIKSILIAVLLTAFSITGGCGKPEMEWAEPEKEPYPSETASVSSPESPREEEAPAEDETADSESADGGIIAQIDALYDKLSRERLELSPWDPFLTTDEASLAELPRQLVFDTPEAYYYAQVIRNYLAPGVRLFDFDFSVSDSINTPQALRIALYRTKPIKWIWKTQGGAGGGKYLWPFEDNIVNALVKREVEEGRGICDVYYAEDVQKTIRRLFGDTPLIIDMDVHPYYYYGKEKIYTRVGDFGGPAWEYPMITAMRPTENGMECDAVITTAISGDEPVWIGDSMDATGLTAENFERLALAEGAMYRYTFTEQNGGHTLTALKTLREESVSK